ncbi:A24 family peptidase [Aneurinibacillus migulanus]|uniref:prepilin peptidase n=1 Tax=Aneurinibacillus migulanus TaxID=47500 RepID=UPI002286A02A|nr:A24 family peptidase [Aneurinibacillus migulanus]
MASVYVTYTDFRFRRIPDYISLSLFFPLLLYRMIEGTIISYVPGFILTAGFLFLIAYFTNGGVGGGDIKLMAAYSLYLPLAGSVFVLISSHIYGLLYGLVFLLFKKKRVEIPMAPGFLLGFILFFCLQI